LDIGRNYFYLKRGKTFLVLLKEREGTALSISGVSATLGATSVADRRVRRVELTPKGRALITQGFGEHAAAMENVAHVLSKNERLTLLRLLKKLGKHAAETHK
jgi:hypothetical protein